jgi:pteridine reductase
MQNNQKTAFITGAARRIGAAIARILHENGMNVVLHYNQSRTEAEALCAALNKQREHSAITLQGNLTAIKNLPHLVEKAAQTWGRLDALVNNASVFYKTPLGQVTEESWDDLITSNLKAPLFLSQAAAPYLAKNEGSIVNITDIHGEHPMREYSAYCISKAGLIMLTKTLAKELGPQIRVNAVSPGAIVWPEEGNALTDDIKNLIIERTALKREGSVDEIAKAVLFFVRDAGYVTGQILGVDGGRTLSM